MFSRALLLTTASLTFLAAPDDAFAQDRPQPPTPHADTAGPFDVLIRGGRVLDGTGNPWVKADVGIRGDRIVAIGNLAGAVAPTVLDADGRYVAPGFIDTHSH
jgi:N-acyl-D-amino-acid deacylase